MTGLYQQPIETKGYYQNSMRPALVLFSLSLNESGKSQKAEYLLKARDIDDYARVLGKLD
jgi:hypothetical protein